MRPEVDDLQRFYASRQGQLARRLIHHQLKALWPDLSGRACWASDTPRRSWPASSTRPGRWRSCRRSKAPVAGPRTDDGRTALAREDELPLADGSIDRVLLVHALECCSNVPRLMREVWRVLADGGRMVAVVPNRRGLWCLSDRTPFGYGQPYSRGQLERTLDSHLFTPCAERTALFMPPTQSRLLLRLAVPAERLGLAFARQFAGVVLVEAEKRIYVGTGSPALTPQPRSRATRRHGWPGGRTRRRRRPRPEPVASGSGGRSSTLRPAHRRRDPSELSKS